MTNTIKEGTAQKESAPAGTKGAIQNKHVDFIAAPAQGQTAQQVRQLVAPVAKHGRRQELGFAAETAALTGESLRSIQRHLARADVLGEHLERIKGTSLDKGTEMDALLKLSEPKRIELIERAIAGKKVSAVAELQAAKDEVHLKVTLRSRTLQGLRKKLIHALEIVEAHMGEGGAQ